MCRFWVVVIITEVLGKWFMSIDNHYMFEHKWKRSMVDMFLWVVIYIVFYLLAWKLTNICSLSQCLYPAYKNTIAIHIAMAQSFKEDWNHFFFWPLQSLRLLLTWADTWMVLPFWTRSYSGMRLNLRPSLSFAIIIVARPVAGALKWLHVSGNRYLVYINQNLSIIFLYHSLSLLYHHHL